MAGKHRCRGRKNRTCSTMVSEDSQFCPPCTALLPTAVQDQLIRADRMPFSTEAGQRHAVAMQAAALKAAHDWFDAHTTEA